MKAKRSQSLKSGKKSIIIDLDVITTAEWDKDKESCKFLDRIKKGEFELHTPYVIIDLVDKWRYKDLVDRIKRFLEINSTYIISARNVFDRLKSLSISDKDIIKELEKKGVKEEDIVIALTGSLFELDYLVTNNRKHLKGKSKEINEVFKKYGLKRITIVGPNEI